MPSILKTSLTVMGLLITLLMLALTASVLWQRYSIPTDLPRVAKQAPLVIENASIVDIENGTVLANRQIYIAAGKIQAINPANSPMPLNVKVVDINNAFVMPGLVDMHTHIYDRKDLVTSLAYGVTEVRNLSGMPMHLRWRDELKRKQWLGASLRTSSPILDNPEHAHLLKQKVNSPAHGKQLVQRFSQQGYDLLKVYTDLDLATYNAIEQEAKRIGMPIAKHGSYSPLSLQRGILHGSDIRGLESVEHVEEIIQTVLDFETDEERLTDFLNALKDSDVFLTPTLATYEHLALLSSGKEVFANSVPSDLLNPFYKMLITELSVKRWLSASQALIDWNQKTLERLLKVTGMADQLGIQLLLGSDQGTMYLTPGLSTHDEMRLLQRAGVAPATIVKAATMNPALAMHKWHSQGSVEVGKIADLVVSIGNPLEDTAALARPWAVVKHGQWLDQLAIDELHRFGRRPSSWMAGLGCFIEDQLFR